MKKAVFFTLLLVFALSGNGMAKDHGSCRKGSVCVKENLDIPDGKWWKKPQIADQLALTQVEKEKLETLYMQHRYRIIDLYGQIEKNRLGVEQLLESETFDAAVCMQRFQKLQRAKTDFATEKFNFFVQVRELLGFERVQQLKQKRRQNHKKRKQERRHSPKGEMPVQ